MAQLTEPIAAVHKLTDFCVGLGLTGLANEDATWRTRNGEGASISWTLGHMMQYRCQVAAMLGGDIDPSGLECFAAAADDGAAYPDIVDLGRRWNEISEQFTSVLKNTTDETLLAPLPDEQLHGEKKLLDNIGFFSFHEAYHAGQLGSIRVERGHPSISTLAMQARE